jgi:transposase
MSAPRKYDREFRERAVRMYRDRLEQGETSLLGARRHVGALLDRTPATLRNWVEEAERTEGGRPAGAAARSSDSEEVKALKKRVAELERANDILKTSAAFFAQAELDRRFK